MKSSLEISTQAGQTLHRGGLRLRAAGGESWLVADAWNDRLDELRSIDWFGPPAARAELVKSNAVRRVWMVRLGGGEVFAKCFAGTGPVDFLLSMVRGSAAYRELRCLQYALQAGVECPRPAALLSQKRGWMRRRHALITEAMAGARTLADHWREIERIDDKAAQRSARLGVCRAVADLFARAHQARFVHRDGHPGNLLVVGAAEGVHAGGRLRVAFADVYGARCGQVVDERAATGSLADLDQWFRRHATRTMRLRFLRRYLAGRFDGPVSRADAKHWSAAIRTERSRRAAVLQMRRDRRIAGDGRHFGLVRLADGTRAGVVLRAFHPDAHPRTAFRSASIEAWREWLTVACLRGFDAGSLAELPAGDWCGADQGCNLVARKLSAAEAGGVFRGNHVYRHRGVAVAMPLVVVHDGEHAGTVVVDWPHVARRMHEQLAYDGAGIDGWAVGRLLAELELCSLDWAGVEPSDIAVVAEDAQGTPSYAFLVDSLRMRLGPWTVDGRSARLAGFVERVERLAGVESNDVAAIRQAFEARCFLGG